MEYSVSCVIMHWNLRYDSGKKPLWNFKPGTGYTGSTTQCTLLYCFFIAGGGCALPFTHDTGNIHACDVWMHAVKKAYGDKTMMGLHFLHQTIANSNKEGSGKSQPSGKDKHLKEFDPSKEFNPITQQVDQKDKTETDRICPECKRNFVLIKIEAIPVDYCIFCKAKVIGNC